MIDDSHKNVYQFFSFIEFILQRDFHVSSYIDLLTIFFSLLSIESIFDDAKIEIKSKRTKIRNNDSILSGFSSRIKPCDKNGKNSQSTTLYNRK